MNNLSRSIAVLVILCAGFFGGTARAQNLDTIGVTLLRAVTTNLNGAGVRVAQPEGGDGAAANWQVNPNAPLQSIGLFTYTSSSGTATNFPNSVGAQSGHANGVAQNFYGISSGVATNVAHVDNYEANYFINHYIVSNLTVLDDLVVNQSFIFGNVSTNIPTPTNYLSVSDQQQIDSTYDDYAAQFKTLFVSGAGNSGSVCPPATCYNGLGVAAYGGNSSVGPTLDNRRAKPDITAPAGATSYSTPQVAGAAAILIQAGLRGDGGSYTNFAADIRMVKALLLNGAVKPANWTNSSSFPLDARYGAGLLNIFNAYRQLAGGKQASSKTNAIGLNGDHPPASVINPVPVNQAWDFADIASSETNDTVVHYFFDVSNVTFTATLVWNRHVGAAGVNDLDLYLYNCANSNEVASSISYVNNVEHLHVTNLTAGRYDLQVVKYGGANVVSNSETYALTWQFVPPPVLAAARAGSNALLTWPLYPAGFCVEARTNLLTGLDWSTNGVPVSIIANGLNSILLNTTNAARFFRLRSPNF